MNFSERLRDIREEKNESVSQLATYLEKSESTIRMWETAKASPDLNTLIKIADYYNVTTDYLLGHDATGAINPIIEENKQLKEKLQQIESILSR